MCNVKNKELVKKAGTTDYSRVAGTPDRKTPSLQRVNVIKKKCELSQ